MSSSSPTLWSLLLCLFPVLSVSAQTFHSRPVLPQIVELYTSEGCSSCPPADRYLSSMAGQPELYRTLFPLAFHVDYWDYIGWSDRFAQKRFSQRQRALAKAGQFSQVYTPAFLVNGQEWRAWFGGARELPAPSGGGTPEVLALSLTLHDQQIRILTRTDNPGMLQSEAYSLSVALTRSGLFTEVRRGENRGRTLTHDFVVLGYAERRFQTEWHLPLSELQVSATLREKFSADGPEAGATLALIAWITGPDGRPLRAAGGQLSTGI